MWMSTVEDCGQNACWKNHSQLNIWCVVIQWHRTDLLSCYHQWRNSKKTLFQRENCWLWELHSSVWTWCLWGKSEQNYNSNTMVYIMLFHHLVQTHKKSFQETEHKDANRIRKQSLTPLIRSNGSWMCLNVSWPPNKKNCFVWIGGRQKSQCVKQTASELACQQTENKNWVDLLSKAHQPKSDPIRIRKDRNNFEQPLEEVKPQSMRHV